jgi:hypothetical protein
MLQRVISFPDGRVIFYYTNKEIIYRKNKEPEIKIKSYNKKGTYGFLGRATDLSSSRRSLSRY